mmetsp:Transcript_23469/g.54742  ORF Transcript_23469/g.54742 Transcript_23469/m.54742 type:complete len:918 (-) Transcript_23469:149-2902(-)
MSRVCLCPHSPRDTGHYHQVELESDGRSRSGDELDEIYNSKASHSDDLYASTVQFYSAVYYASESEAKVTVEVVRLGEDVEECSVDYFTADNTAKAGRKYVAQRGTLRFEKGEFLQKVEIDVIDDDSWDATLEFSVHLAEPKNCHVGIYLDSCRVKIIDDDCFPTNKFRASLKDCDEELEKEVPGVALFFEYCKLNMSQPVICWGTIKYVILDQFKNLYFFMTLYLQMYLIDVVLAPGEELEEEEPGRSGNNHGHGEESSHAVERRLVSWVIEGAMYGLRRLLEEEGNSSAIPGAESEEEEYIPLLGHRLLVNGDRKSTAILVGCLYIAPFVLLNCIDMKKIALEVDGHARQHLQANLLRKFLNYKESSRATVSTGDLTMALVRDIKEVVDAGYMKFLALLRAVGGILLASIFILSENTLAILPLFTFPAIMACFVCLRSERTIDLFERQALRENQAVFVISDVIRNFRIFADFQLRPLAVQVYEERVHQFNQAHLTAEQRQTVNMYLPPWLTTILVGGYFMVSPLIVVTCGGTVTLGAFLATVNVFKEVGMELAELYHEIMEIQRSIGPLRKVVHFMNLPTELEDRMVSSRKRALEGLARWERQRDAARRAGRHSRVIAETAYAVDAMPITAEGVHFQYDHRFPLLQNLSVSLPQGRMYAFVGPHNEGKSTLLRLLGNMLLPKEEVGGKLFVPPHLRVLHITHDAFILSNTLISNLVFDMKPAKYGGLERVRAICRRMGFAPSLLHQLDEEIGERMSQGRSGEAEVEAGFAELKWISEISITDRAKLNIARALIHNPEFLVMHRPVLGFNDKEVKSMMTLLHEHVENRGMELPRATRARRCLRTVCYTSAGGLGANMADVVYQVSQAEGIRKLDHQMVSDAMLEEHAQIVSAASAKAFPETSSPRPLLPVSEIEKK